MTPCDVGEGERGQNRPNRVKSFIEGPESCSMLIVYMQEAGASTPQGNDEFSPISDFSPILEKMSVSVENFPNFTFPRQIFPIFSKNSRGFYIVYVCFVSPLL